MTRISTAEGHRQAMDAYLDRCTNPVDREVATSIRDRWAEMSRAETRGEARTRRGRGVPRTERLLMRARILGERHAQARRSSAREDRQAMRREILVGRGWSPKAIDADPGEIKWLPSGATVNVNCWDLKAGR